MIAWAAVVAYLALGGLVAVHQLFTGGILVGIMLLAPIPAAWWRRRRLIATWRAVGEEHGLGHTAPYHLVGTANGVTMELASSPALASLFALRRTTCSARIAGLPPTLRVFDRTVWSELSAPAAFRCGDPEFDQRVACAGDDDALLAILDGENRRALPHAVEVQGMSLADGALTWTRRHHVTRHGDLANLIEETARLAQRVTDAVANRPTRLLENARQDRIPGVRTRNLETLLTQHKGSQAARLAADWALRQPEPEVRFAAARHLGARGLEPLAKLARRFDLAVELRRAVIDHLARAYPASQTTEVLVECSLRDDAAAASAIAHLAGLDPAAALGVVEQRVAIAPEAMLHRFAEVLRRVDVARAEPLWLRMLDRQGVSLEPIVQIVGELGGRGFLEPLARIAEGEHYQEARTARFAREQIRARLGDSLGEGQLSLSDEGGGELTLAAEAGALSDAERDRRREPGSDA